ncbi:DUF6597 domain-containing transcriptional factor [Paenibacillus sp. MABNR03]|uniref:DUF6597 domain-containing transcriptional factor n=1 Tax=Paenibacillus sp. MABNR03 TaxID=3142626 RepID=UPI003D2650C9
MDLQTYYIEQPPSPVLTAYIACFWESGITPYAGYNLTEGVPSRVLPDGCTDILITYNAVCEQHSFAYCGNYTERKLYGETPLTAAREHRRRLSELYNRPTEPSFILESREYNIKET